MAVQSICGVILLSSNPEKLASFYAEVLGFTFEKEEHGGLLTHYGADIGQTHFGIHPASNFNLEQSGTKTKTAVAFQVESLEVHIKRLNALEATCLQAPHDEGFGLTTSYLDPEQNILELTELSYQFEQK